MMERQLGQLVRLIDDLLDVSRITQGKLELRKERVDLAVRRSRAPSRPPRPLIEALGPRAARRRDAEARLRSTPIRCGSRRCSRIC